MNEPPDPVGDIEEELRAIHRQGLAQGTAALDLIEARHRGDVPPYFLCPRCGFMELDGYVDIPGDDPVLIGCARCLTEFKVAPWEPDDAVELEDHDWSSWYPKRILLGPEHCCTKSELERAKQEHDHARIEAEWSSNPSHDQQREEEGSP